MTEHQHVSAPQPANGGYGSTSPFGLFAPAVEYAVDAAQRCILFWDVMRQRGNQYREHLAEKAPNVLNYKAELVLDGRRLERPVNYLLVRILPPEGTEIDPALRPFVVVDPRAGHGPGIGGFKADSEIGVIMKAGHPCYFIGFLPDPMPGQTIEDVARAEAVFLEKVIALHPQADGKPCVIGNCQAGWAVMLLAGIRPDLFGPIIIAGAPLSYWQGVHGKYPMRYSAGLLGGSWLTALTSDLGHGKFDGAWLVQNFENQNPANTLWTKQYNLYSKIDTEASRYLGFERWWGGHVNLNAEEIQFIVDQLFIGNNLTAGKIQTSDGVAVDLRNIHSPIVVFCSKGDNVTPPQQALGWILDLYDDADEIRAYGQTIVYTIHDSIGHLGIFVSAGVARKQHSEFSSNIDLIDTLPPGLYEAVFEAKTGATANPELASGDWVMRCEARTLDDIRALGGNDPADEHCFAAVDRMSQTNLALYRTFMQPFVRAAVTPQLAEALRVFHPLRWPFEVFSDANPAVAPLATLAEKVREQRRPVSEDNPFLLMQENMSHQIVAALEGWRKTSEALAERMFMTEFGAPTVQAALGVDPNSSRPLRKAGKSAIHEELVARRIGELKSHIASGGVREAVIRALLFGGMARAAVDERGFEVVRRIRHTQSDIPLSAFKAMVREQFYMLLIDTDAALAAIPAMLPDDPETRQKAFDLIMQVLNARGEPSAEDETRIARIAGLFGVDAQLAAPGNRALAANENPPPARAS
jgi:pimeloyl-ACP methyl ester carboxylesterase